MTPAERIRARIDAGLRRAGERTGEGPLVVTLIKPGVPTGPEYDSQQGPATEHPLTVIQESHMQRDQSGTLIGEAIHGLIVSAHESAIPERADRIRMNDGRVVEIISVAPTAPGGIALLWEVEVSD